MAKVECMILAHVSDAILIGIEKDKEYEIYRKMGGAERHRQVVIRESGEEEEEQIDG